MTAVHSPIEKREDAVRPATGVDGAITVRPNDRETRRPSTYFAVGTIALVVLLGVFQYWVTSVEESRSQSELLRALKVDLASTADGGVPAPAAVGHPIGLLEIPAIGLEKVAVEGSSARRVEQGPGHEPASARPGEAGDALFVGRRTSYGSPFAHLGRLHDGDTISITTARGRFTYLVDHSATRAAARSGRGTLTLATGARGFVSDRVVTVTAVLQGKPLLLGTKLRALRPVGLDSIGGWLSDSSAWFWIAFWGALLVLALVVAARSYRTTSTRITYLLSTPVIVALLFCTLGALDRLVPVTR
ncbi:MAG: sortase [Actinomycetota bacterium]|nr:sortase [Actinomycetota bacterium]